ARQQAGVRAQGGTRDQAPVLLLLRQVTRCPTGVGRYGMHAPKVLLSYPRFLSRALGVATDGGWSFYLWMTALTAVALVGANAWAVQVRDGMARTNMTDHVSWGLYIANFTFCVGLAAGGVMMVIPAYLYHDHDMHDVVIIGE